MLDMACLKFGYRFHKMDITRFLEDNPRIKTGFSTLYPILDDPEKSQSIMQDMRSWQEFLLGNEVQQNNDMNK